MTKDKCTKILLNQFYTFIVTSILSYTQQNNPFKKVKTIIDKAIADKAFPGAVVLVWKDGNIIYEKAYGRFTYDSIQPKVSISTIYDIASLTKVIATTTATMICYDRNLFALDDKVAKYIPQFAVNGKEKHHHKESSGSQFRFTCMEKFLQLRIYL